MKPPLVIALLVTTSVASVTASAADGSPWTMDVGVRGFKYSAEPTPSEIGPNRVFDRWEQISHDSVNYAVSHYEPLTPLYFNFSLGADVMIRYQRHLMLKVGYDYSNPFGIGGSGTISYTDRSSGVRYLEEKTFSYTSHQITTFIGPTVPIGDDAEIYMGFSPMAPTWVSYREKYTKQADRQTTERYGRRYHGFHGNCRALFGIQITAWDHLKVGTEAVFSFLNYMKLSSGKIEDSSFRFPAMMYNVTLRYQLF
jgi:hypothetical protein